MGVFIFSSHGNKGAASANSINGLRRYRFFVIGWGTVMWAK
jgi:hypothetical protein